MFPRQQSLRERISISHYKYIVSLVFLPHMSYTPGLSIGAEFERQLLYAIFQRVAPALTLQSTVITVAYLPPALTFPTPAFCPHMLFRTTIEDTTVVIALLCRL